MKAKSKTLYSLIAVLATALAASGEGTSSSSTGGTPPSTAEPAPVKKAGNSTKPTDLFTKPRAVVKIPFEGEEVEVNVVLTDFQPNRRAKDGISALQIGDLAAAKTAFEEALRENGKRHTHHFALAVCLEALGDYAGAKAHYAEANRLKGGQDGLFDAQAGLKRLAARKK